VPLGGAARALRRRPRARRAAPAQRQPHGAFSLPRADAPVAAEGTGGTLSIHVRRVTAAPPKPALRKCISPKPAGLP